MKIYTLALHGFVLALCNLAMLNAAFLAWSLVPNTDQVIVQGWLALLLSTACFFAWGWIFRRLGGAPPRGFRQGAVVFLAAALFAALIFVLLHRTTQGYWTSAGNLLAIWIFQVPANGLALILVSRTIGNK